MTSRERSPGWPDTPTIAESGVPDYGMEGWYAVLVPAATPDSAVRALNAALGQALRSPEVKARLETLGIQPLGGTPEEAASFIAAEARKWEKVIKDAQIKAD